MEPRTHRRKAKLRNPLALAIAAGAALLVGVMYAMTPATAVTVINTDDMRQACVNRLAQGTKGLPSASVTWLRNCASVAPAPPPTGSPSPTTSSPTPTPTVTGTPTPTPTTPSPSPTTTSPSPTPTATGTVPAGGCIVLPSACGFPDATNTGAASGLPVVTGDLTLTNGQTLADTEVHGCILVTGSNVVIRNVKVSCTGNYVIDVTSGSATASATITDVTVDCGGNAGGTAIGEHNVSAIRINVSGCVNGFDLDADASIVDSYCHGLTDEVQFPDAHTDCVQGIMTNDITIRHNTLYPGHFATSAIGGGVAGVRWVVDGNLLDGGAYPVYCNAGGAGAGSQVTNNRFGTDGWNAPAYATGCNQPAISWSGNVRDATGASLPAA